MAKKYYYRCKSNPSAPLLVLEAEWEAREMRTNTEYDQVDESGLPVVPDFDTTDSLGIPFTPAR